MCSSKEKLLRIVQEINDAIPMDASVNLLDGGYIDSFDIANIVPAMEQNFDIEILPEEIIPENFLSVDRMFDMMQRIKGAEKE